MILSEANALWLTMKVSHPKVASLDTEKLNLKLHVSMLSDSLFRVVSAFPVQYCCDLNFQLDLKMYIM